MTKKIVGVICALTIEMELFSKKLNNLKKEVICGHEFFVGLLDNNVVVLTISGIGKVNSGIITMLLIEHYQPDLVINSGIAGGVNKKLKTLDVVIATGTIYYDVDMTSDVTTSLRYGQLQDLPFVYKTDEVMIDTLRNIDFPFSCYYGIIMTGDQFVSDYHKVSMIVDNHFQDLDVLACDMESCSIAQVCYLFKTKCLIIRAISDVVGSNRPFDYSTFAPKAASNAALITLSILKNL